MLEQGVSEPEWEKLIDHPFAGFRAGNTKLGEQSSRFPDDQAQHAIKKLFQKPVLK